jgi:threonine/homoserine/homoserine lactone efflux protein
MALPVDPARYLAFMCAMAILAITPGPSNLYAVANGIARGRKAVLLGVAGMNSATLVWYAAAALGLSALALTFPGAVRALILIGALYLIWLAYQSLASGFRRPATDHGPWRPRPLAAGSPYWGAFMVQIANPKILLFFGAVLPPFLDFRRPLPAQFVMFVIATVGLDVIATLSYGFGGAALAARMTDRTFYRGFSIVVAVVLTLAAGLIVSRV